MTKEQKKITKKHYTKEFKDQAVELAKDIGAQEAAVKLGIKSYQTLSNTNSDYYYGPSLGLLLII
jgi:transposase-like protein